MAGAINNAYMSLKAGLLKRWADTNDSLRMTPDLGAKEFLGTACHQGPISKLATILLFFAIMSTEDACLKVIDIGVATLLGRTSGMKRWARWAGSDSLDVR